MDRLRKGRGEGYVLFRGLADGVGSLRHVGERHVLFRGLGHAMVRANLGPFAPDWKDCEEWFRSDETMWLGTWHDHVTGWWNRGNQMDNVLIVRFEDMVQDLPTIVHEVASFLELDELSGNETDEIVRKCSFEYMSENADCFEMQPPHLLQHASQYFVSGSSNRHEDVPIQTRQNLLDWCRRKSHGSEVPADVLYSDLPHCEQVSRR